MHKGALAAALHAACSSAAHPWVVATLLPSRGANRRGCTNVDRTRGGGAVSKVIQLMPLHLQLEQLDIVQTRPSACNHHSA